MKKFLSLVLALVMTMSLVTVSAGAKDFTDSDKIQYTEAVDVMSAVKVIDGYTDGSFNPSATLTRGAAAKIICNLILGPTTASALVADAAPYKDVPTNHTFAGYIAYCQKEGIISGYADGTFKPANSLTGYAFMKMLLGALGYDAEVEGYTGPNWSINVAKRALNIGLSDDLVGSFNGVKAVNREEACLYAFNTLQATMVEYDSTTNITVGGAQVVIAGSKAKEVACTEGKGADGNIDEDGKVQFAEKYFTDLKKIGTSDDFNRPATQWKIKAEEVGKYTDAADLTYTKAVESGDIYKDLDLGDTIAAKKVTVYVNGEEATADKIAIAKGNDTEIGKATDTNGNGVLTEVFYDKDNDSVIITQIVTYVGEINKTVKATSKKDAYVVLTTKDSSTSTKNVTTPVSVDGKTHPSKFEFETDEKFADETYVLYTYSFKADEVKSVVAAEKVEGYVSKTINKVSGHDENKGMTIAGTDYKMSLTTAGEALDDVSVKNDYTVYLDQYGYIIYVEEIKEIGNYALLLNSANKGSFIGNKAQLLLTDGTVKFVTTDKDYTGKINNNKIVTFRENSDGTYTLREVTGTKTNATGSSSPSYTAFTMTNDKAGITVAGASSPVTANSASVFVVADQPSGTTTAISTANGKVLAGEHEDIDDWTAYTGIKEAPSVSGSADQVAVYYYCKSGSMVTVMFVVPTSTASVVDSNKNSIFFANESVSKLIHDEDESYFEYNAIVDGKVTTVKVKYNTASDSTLDGMYKNYTVNKGYITGTTPYAVPGADAYTGATTAKQYLKGAGIAKTSKDYTVTLDTYGSDGTDGISAVITVDDDAKIYFVDKKGNITEASYSAIYQDMNDKVYAIVEDYLVKTLVIEEVDDVVLSNKASVGTITLAAGVTSTGYSTIKEAVANAVDVAKNTPIATTTTGSDGTVACAFVYGVNGTEKDSDLTWLKHSNWVYETGHDCYLVKVTATSADGLNKDVKYVAVKVVETYTMTIKTATAGQAAMVSVDGEAAEMITDAGSTFTVTNGSTIAVTEIAGGTTVAIATTNGAAWVAGTNVWTLRGLTADPTVTLTIS